MISNIRNKFILRICSYCMLVLIIAITLPCDINKDTPKTVHVLFVRHGKTVANSEGRLVGSGGDSPLLANAKEAAQALGVELQNVKIDGMYVSEMGRTQETLAYICEGAKWKGEYTILPEVNDISWGDAEGYTGQEFLNYYGYEKMPDAFGDAHDKEYVSPINAETKYSFCNRFMKGVRNIIEESDDGDTVICVTHNSLTFWVEYVFDYNVSIDNLGIIELVYEEKESTLYFQKENEVKCINYKGDILKHEE